MIGINEEEVILKLIEQGCQEGGSVGEDRIFKMAQILNISQESYEKVKTKLLESGKINKEGDEFFLL